MSVLRALTLATLLGTAALASAPSQAAAQDERDVRVVVTNNNFLDMHVYAVDRSLRQSLGLVTGLTRRSFNLRDWVDRELQILAEPIGSRSNFITDVYYMDPNEQLNVTLHNNLQLSWTTVSARPGLEVEVPDDEEEDERDDDGDPNQRNVAVTR